MELKKIVSIVLSFVLVLSVISSTPTNDVVAAGSYSRTYTKMVDYNYGEKNKGFYMVPDKPGKYPVIFMFHGASEKSSSNWEYRSYLMDTVNKWIALGYMDPMVIVVPNIEREDATDDWSCYAFNYYITYGRFGSLLKKIKNGETEFDNKVDHSKKFSVTGFSMGGVESLFIGTKYSTDFINVGACSPSYMYYHVSVDLNGVEHDDGWVKRYEIQFTSDSNAHLFMGYGIQEADFKKSVERYDKVHRETKNTNPNDFVIYGSYNGGHAWETFSREIFSFIYYMKFDVLPDAATVEKACKDRYLDYGDGGSGNGGSNSSGSGLKSNSGGSGSGSGSSGSGKKVTNQWVDGYWYGSTGSQKYKPKASWKHNAKGWWYEDTSGWYAKSQWQKIDSKWYYFGSDGYMASNQWIDGYWLCSSGDWKYTHRGSWKHSSKGWWFGDTSGWYAKNQWQKIDGKWYYFDSTGYMVTNKKVDGYWVGDDGVCQ